MASRDTKSGRTHPSSRRKLSRSEIELLRELAEEFGFWPTTTDLEDIERHRRHSEHPRQLKVFDDPERDERGWVLSVAHVDVVSLDRLGSRFPATTRLRPAQAPGRLTYDHADIVARAVEHLRSRYAATPDPDGLLGDQFTLLELRLVHEAVAGHDLMRDAFRRAMERHLVPTRTTIAGNRGRPAELFWRRRGTD